MAFAEIGVLLLIAMIMTALEICGKLPIGKPDGALQITLLPHCTLIVWSVIKFTGLTGAAAVCAGIITGIFLFTAAVKMSVKPHNRKLRVKTRVKALYGGKVLIGYSAFSMLVQTVWFIVMGVNGFFGMPRGIAVADSIVTAVLTFGFMLNGVFRVLLLCYRLNIVKRLIVFLLLPVPVVNIFVLLYMYKIAESEYAYEDTKVGCEEQRAESQVCCTKYPLLLVHGIGFRDRRYFNYWGRIPKELIRNGATIYYGMQEGCIP